MQKFFNIDSVPINAKRVVVVGDGPAAMIAAIKLKEAGVVDVTMVGPRIGNYTRSGDLNSEVFDEVAKAAPSASIHETDDRHIKDLENQLYNCCKGIGIKFVNKRFTGFKSKRKILVTNPNYSVTEEIKADLIFDCTGVKRAVINTFNNESTSKFKFKVDKICKQPLHMAMLRLHYPKVDDVHFKEVTDLEQRRILALLEIRKLGWDNYLLPAYYRSEIGTKNKENFYFMVPEHALLEECKKIGLLLEGLNHLEYNPPISGESLLHKPSKKHPEKTIITKFTLDSKLTTPTLFKGDSKYPAIMPVGDSKLDVPFIYASSLITCARLLTILFANLKIKHGAVKSMNVTNYERFANAVIQEQIAEITKGDAEIEQQLKDQKEKALRNFEETLPKLSDANEKSLIENEIDKLKDIMGLTHLKPRLSFHRSLPI